MHLLIVAADKGGHFAPFIEEQITAIQQRDIHLSRYAVTGKGIYGYLRELPRLSRTIRTLQPDIIHAHYGLCGLLVALAVRLTPSLSRYRKRLVTTYHGSDINNRHVLHLSRMAMHASAWNIFVSQANKQKALIRGTKRLTNYSVIPCGIDLTDDQRTTRDEARRQLATILSKQGIQLHAPFILFAGAFDNPVKDAPLAQAAVSILNPDVRLIELTGYTRQEVSLLMCAANCLLLTSKTEGSPQVIKEAMACSCPIVSVDVGDVRENIVGLPDCYVATTRQPQELAQLLHTALSRQQEHPHTAAQHTPVHAIAQQHPYATAQQEYPHTAARQRLLQKGLTNTQVASTLQTLYSQIQPPIKH